MPQNATSSDYPASDAVTIMKDWEVWFEDGNLILQALDGTCFKIFRGLLCKKSSVFRDMFEFPAPAEGNYMVEGCPVVPTFDSAQDLRYFLRALTDSEFFEPPPKPTTIPIVEGVLRLASKYDVPHLRQRAMDHLVSTYPTTLAAWKTRDTSRTIPSVENTPFLVLNLAREFDMPWLIPSVAYCITSHDINKTLDGAEWSLSESTQATLGGKCAVNERGAKLVQLSWDDRKMCIKGRNNILLKQNAQSLKIAKGIRGPGQSAVPGTPNNGAAAIPAPNPAPALGATANAAIPPPPPAAAGAAPPPPAGAALAALPTLTPNLSTASLASTSSSPSPRLNPIDLPCPNDTQCTYTRFRCSEILTRWGTAGFLDFFDEQHSAFAPGFCEGCLARFEWFMKRASEDMWDALPELFGVVGNDHHGSVLSGWEELDRLRRLSTYRKPTGA